MRNISFLLSSILLGLSTSAMALFSFDVQIERPQDNSPNDDTATTPLTAHIYRLDKGTMESKNAYAYGNKRAAFTSDLLGLKVDSWIKVTNYGEDKDSDDYCIIKVYSNMKGIAPIPPYATVTGNGRTIHCYNVGSATGNPIVIAAVTSQKLIGTKLIARKPALKATPILANVGTVDQPEYETIYRVSIHSGEFTRGYPFESPTDITPHPIPFDHWMPHSILAFEPYTINICNESNDCSTEKVLPISTVHLQKASNIVSPISLFHDTDFMYIPKNENNGFATTSKKSLRVTQSMIATIDKDTNTETPTIKPLAVAHSEAETFSASQPDTVNDPEFSLESHRVSLSVTGNKIYGNGLNQAVLKVSIGDISPDDKKYGWLYDHLYFKDVSSGSVNGPILSNTYQDSQHGYSSVSHTPGPYANSLLRSTGSNSKSAEHSPYYYLSTTEKHNKNIEIKAMLCLKEHDPMNPAGKEVCQASNTITVTAMDSDLQTINGSLQPATSIAFNHNLFQPITGTPSKNEGPTWIDFPSKSTFGFPLIYGVPNYCANEIEPCFNSLSSTKDIESNDEAFKEAKQLTPLVVDIYGNPFYKTVHKMVG